MGPEEEAALTLEDIDGFFFTSTKQRGHARAVFFLFHEFLLLSMIRRANELLQLPTHEML